MKKFNGGCQCGKVRFEVDLQFDHVVSCNCSRCAKLGSLLAFAPLSDFKLLSGADDTTEFLFNKHVIRHRFCRTCGIEPYAIGTRPDGAEMAAINVRCLDGVDVEAFAVKKFEGQKI
jgi:hypothetical protein